MKREGWREILVQEIVDSFENTIILEDKQNFLEDQILHEMIQSKVVLCQCADSVDIFHCLQENQRKKVVLQVQPHTIVPYRVQTNAKEIEFSSSKLFPLLNQRIMTACGIETYDIVFEYYRSLKPSHVPLTERQTNELIVQALFALDLNRITLESSLTILLTLYNRTYKIPAELLEEIRKAGNADGQSRDITVLEKTPSEVELKSWLSEQWRGFLSDQKTLLDFYNPQMATLMPTLFASGVLPRQKIRDQEQFEKFVKCFSNCPWLITGLEFQFSDKRQARSSLEMHLKLIQQMILDATEQPTPEKWLEAAQQWGRIQYLEYKGGLHKESEVQRVSGYVERLFRDYIITNYDKVLIGSTSSNPLTVDKILPNIANQRNDNRVAIILFDGMGIDQWEIVKAYLTSRSLGVKKEQYVYAMLPTLTGYSRQSIFSAKTPNEFKRFRAPTEEKSFFRDFWMSKGIPAEDIVFLHLVPDPKALKDPNSSMVEFLTSANEGAKILAVIFTFIDKRLHGPYDLDVGKKFLYSRIEEFLESSCLAEIFEILLDAGYRVYLTSDHGNVVASGNGVSDSKNLVEMQGKRCLVYDSKALAEEKQKEADVTLFYSRFIPNNQFILFPNGNYFFGAEGAKEITHGGISIEEATLPFVEVEK